MYKGVPGPCERNGWNWARSRTNLAPVHQMHPIRLLQTDSCHLVQHRWRLEISTSRNWRRRKGIDAWKKLYASVVVRRAISLEIAQKRIGNSLREKLVPQEPLNKSNFQQPSPKPNPSELMTELSTFDPLTQPKPQTHCICWIPPVVGWAELSEAPNHTPHRASDEWSGHSRDRTRGVGK